MWVVASASSPHARDHLVASAVGRELFSDLKVGFLFFFFLINQSEARHWLDSARRFMVSPAGNCGVLSRGNLLYFCVREGRVTNTSSTVEIASVTLRRVCNPLPDG